MRPAATRSSFFEAPAGRYLRGRTWIFACAHEGFYGTFLTGRPDEADLAELTRAYAVPAAREIPHVSLLDASRVEEVDAAAFGLLLDFFVAHLPGLARRITRLAFVHGPGVAGATIAGYPKVLPLECPVRIFDDGAAALDWLDGSDAALRAELVRLVDSLASEAPERTRLRAI